jgi:hypothetical protein
MARHQGVSKAFPQALGLRSLWHSSSAPCVPLLHPAWTSHRTFPCRSCCRQVRNSLLGSWPAGRDPQSATGGPRVPAGCALICVLPSWSETSLHTHRQRTRTAQSIATLFPGHCICHAEQCLNFIGTWECIPPTPPGVVVPPPPTGERRLIQNGQTVARLDGSSIVYAGTVDVGLTKQARGGYHVPGASVGRGTCDAGRGVSGRRRAAGPHRAGALQHTHVCMCAPLAQILRYSDPSPA